MFPTFVPTSFPTTVLPTALSSIARRAQLIMLLAKPFFFPTYSLHCNTILPLPSSIFSKLKPIDATSTSTRSLSPPDLFYPPGISRDDDLTTESLLLPFSNILIGPYAGDAKIKTVEFIKSSASAKDCPLDDKPEFAILGRSNVGKSSLINSLVKKKEFALTSKKPGKTRLINHFLINKSWYIVDLPGYGFANASKSSQTDWTSFTKGYFLNRDSLVCVMLLIDASIPPQQIDLDCANWLGRNKIGITFVFTKCDKVKGGKGSRPDDNVKKFLEMLSKYYAESQPWIMTSSVTGLGREDLLLHMSQLRNYWDN